MFCRRTRAVFSTILITMAAGGCARKPVTLVERLAILPLENLSSDSQWNWYARAAPAVVEYDLAGSKNIFAKTVESLSAAQSMQASRMLEGYFVESNGRITIRATVEDLRTTRAVEHFQMDGPVASGWLPLANELARRLSGGARPFGTTNESAFRFYGEALAAPGVEAAVGALESAKAADPRFALFYGDQARLLAAKGARVEALQTIQAGEREPHVDAIDRADLRYLAAAASGDANARIQALETLAGVTPANATLYFDLGQTQFARRNFQAAVRNFQTAAQLNPDELRTWNELGYALAWTGNLNGARSALEEYEKRSPGDANALDSLGEVSFFLGDFESAVKYFEQAAKKSPQELMKAAEARLMLGDLKAADALVAKYLGPAEGPQRGRAAFLMAQWEFLTGRRAAGRAAMEKLEHELTGEQQSRVRAQLAIWGFESGGPVGQDLGEVSGPVRLLLAGKFREALPELQAAYEATNPSIDGQIRVLLAWARIETGGLAEAGNLLAICPLPLSSGQPMLASLIFPRYFALRAVVLEKQGKTDEAKKNRDLYLEYAGGDATK